MKYYFSITDEGSKPVVIYARNKYIVRALLNDDCETISLLTSVEAKRLIEQGFQLIK